MTNSRGNPPVKRFRLQFSLRMMLLLMAAVGVGLSVFRWPWEESKVNQIDTRTTTYRRAWNGKPLKHGPERVVINRSGLLWYEAFNFDGELRREWKFDPPGQIKTEIRYVPERGEKRVRNFATFAREGIVIETTSWKDNQRLKREWRTFEGQLLESQLGLFVDTFDYRPTQWNGQPADEALRRVLADLPDADARTAWLAPRSTSGFKAIEFLGDGTLLLRAPVTPEESKPAPPASSGQTVAKVPRDVAVHFAGRQDLPLHLLESHVTYNCDSKKSDESRAAPALAQQLLGFAAQHDAMFCCRFGVVCLVPIGQAVREPADPTGVLAVKFPKESAQARDWLEAVDELAIDVSPSSARVQKVFARTSIDVDVAALRANEPFDETRIRLPAGTLPRARRDWLGLFLWRHNCRVKQHENRLIVSPRED